MIKTQEERELIGRMTRSIRSSPMTAEGIKEILRLHALWLAHQPGGVCVNLPYANMNGADFGGADLSGASLRRARFSYTNFGGANLSRANFAHADFTGADFTGANLAGADLTGANFSGANLEWANLANSNLRSASGIISFGPVGEARRIGYATSAGVQLGCFWGSPEEACEAVQEKYGPNSAYEALILAAVAALED